MPITFDAQAAMGFVVSQTTHIEQGVYNIRYPDIQYPGLIPVDFSANPFAQTVTYYSADKFGQARWINGNSDDIPIAGSERSKHQTAVYTAGIGYGWGWEEINTAMMLGIPLQSDDAAAAKRAYEEFVDDVALRGDDTKNFKGLINNSAVTPVGATYGDWFGTGIDESHVLADVNNALIKTYVDTKTVAIADTLLLPVAHLNFLAVTRLGDTLSTLLMFLKEHNTYTAITGRPLTIRAVRGLETAGTGNSARMIAYRRSPEVLKLHIPMPHRFLPVYQQGPLRWDVPGVFRLGGLDIRLPKEVSYIDGI